MIKLIRGHIFILRKYPDYRISYNKINTIQGNTLRNGQVKQKLIDKCSE